MDELRLSDMPRSTDWSRAEYLTVADPYFTAYQLFPAYSVDADGDGMPDRWELEPFGATNAPAGNARSSPGRVALP